YCNNAYVITSLFDLAKEANMYFEENQTGTVVLDAFQQAIESFLQVLGIAFVEEELLEGKIEALIEERNEARKSKNYARADEIRDLLKEKSIVLEDTPQGVRWRKEGRAM